MGGDTPTTTFSRRSLRQEPCDLSTDIQRDLFSNSGLSASHGKWYRRQTIEFMSLSCAFGLVDSMSNLILRVFAIVTSSFVIGGCLPLSATRRDRSLVEGANGSRALVSKTADAFNRAIIKVHTVTCNDWKWHSRVKGRLAANARIRIAIKHNIKDSPTVWSPREPQRAEVPTPLPARGTQPFCSSGQLERSDPASTLLDQRERTKHRSVMLLIGGQRTPPVRWWIGGPGTMKTGQCRGRKASNYKVVILGGFPAPVLRGPYP